MNAEEARSSKYPLMHPEKAGVVDWITLKDYAWVGLHKDGIYIQLLALPIFDFTDNQAMQLKRILEVWYPE